MNSVVANSWYDAGPPALGRRVNCVPTTTWFSSRKSRAGVAQADARVAQHDAALGFAPATKSNGDGSARSPFTLTWWRTAFTIVRRQLDTNVIHSCPTRTPDTLTRFGSVMTTIQRTFRAEERLILDAEALAQARGITLSDVVRVALRSELERNYEARLTKLASELGATDYAEYKEMEGTLGDGLENHPA